MRGQGPVPIVDVVRLVLLILFLGIQWRRRPRNYVGFWFAGWIFVFLSYVAWAVGEMQPRFDHLKDAACFDFMLVGVLIFLTSQVAKEQRPRKIMLVGAAIGLVNVAIINVHEFVSLPRVLLVLMVLLWQGDSLYIAHALLSKTWVRRRALIFAICVVFGVALLRYVWMTPAINLDKFAVMEVLLCAAVLYADTEGIGTFGRYVGVAGFVLWAAYYFVNIPLTDQSQAQKLVYEFRNFPKYFVAFTMILKIFEDATAEQTRLAERFRELYEDFRLIYDSHPYPMWICDGDGRFLTVNAATLKEYGYGMEELLEMRFSALESPGDMEAEDIKDIESVLGAPAEGTRMQHRHKEGRVFWVNIVDREITYLGQEARFVIARNITERLKMDRELSHRAQHDALTGLPNRQLLVDRLEQCLNICEREQRKAALFTIDVDHFKLINDTYGHLVGDECLVQVAARLKSKIRKVDTIARTGGEEFTAVVSGLSRASDAEKVAASLLRMFETPVELAIGAVGVTVSIGVAVYPDDAMDAETLRQRSDEAMYRAKRAGRNRAAYTFEAHESVGSK
jgi:diguanylate cyclase (GGDEF)-like protein/PAS domain S-box-containing protein